MKANVCCEGEKCVKLNDTYISLLVQGDNTIKQNQQYQGKTTLPVCLRRL